MFQICLLLSVLKTQRYNAVPVKRKLFPNFFLSSFLYFLVCWLFYCPFLFWEPQLQKSRRKNDWPGGQLHDWLVFVWTPSQWTKMGNFIHLLFQRKLWLDTGFLGVKFLKKLKKARYRKTLNFHNFFTEL